MKIKLYTRDQNLQGIAENQKECVVESAEWSMTRQKGNGTPGFSSRFETRESFLAPMWELDYAIGFRLSSYLREIGAERVLSLASGPAYHEYLIKKELPGIHLTVSDFDPFIIDTLKRLFPEYEEHIVFNIKEEDFSKMRGKYDTVIIIEAIYAFSDLELVYFLQNIRRMEPVNLLIIMKSYADFKKCFTYYRNIIFKSIINLKKGIMKEPALSWGRFHGWSRSRGTITKLVRKSDVFKLKIFEDWRDIRSDVAFCHLIPR
jgi:hypothetical protein